MVRGRFSDDFWLASGGSLLLAASPEAMRIDILTLFPEIALAPLSESTVSYTHLRAHET